MKIFLKFTHPYHKVLFGMLVHLGSQFYKFGHAYLIKTILFTTVVK